MTGVFDPEDTRVTVEVEPIGFSGSDIVGLDVEDSAGGDKVDRLLPVVDGVSTVPEVGWSAG
jgi:hypothetical protein